MTEISGWFNLEVSRWRSGAALVWTSVLTPLFVYTAVALANINAFHPIDWLVASLIRMFEVWTWPYLAMIIACIVLSSIHTVNELTVTPIIHSSRWARLCSVCRPRSVYQLVWTGVLSGLTAWSYLKLVQGDYDSLTHPCQHDVTHTCLNEPHLFIMLHGIYVGVGYKITAFVTGQNQLLFPILQQSKFFQMKRSAVANITKATSQTLHRLKYYYILYYLFFGGVIQNFFVQRFSYELCETPLNTLSGLLDIWLLWHSIICGSLILVMFTLSTQLLKVYHTEWHQFPIETTIQRFQNLCLHNAMSCHSNSLVQYHSYQDICILAKHSQSRRQQIYSLTQLGGHPQNWCNISKECLGLLHSLLDDIKAYNVKVMADGSMKHLVGESALTTGGTTTNGLTHRQVPRDENLKQPAPPTNNKSSPLQMIISDLKKKRVVSFFVAEDQDACSRRLFSKSQLYIWAVDALSHLTCASYTEDKYGVVQKTLPEIVDILTSLQEQIEKHFRLVASIGKRPECECEEDQEAALRTALKNTVKASLYRIVKTFNTHIRSIPLSGEHMRRLGHFLDYKE